jgi:hypothetical protein
MSDLHCCPAIQIWCKCLLWCKTQTIVIVISFWIVHFFHIDNEQWDLQETSASVPTNDRKRGYQVHKLTMSKQVHKVITYGCGCGCGCGCGWWLSAAVEFAELCTKEKMSLFTRHVGT